MFIRKLTNFQRNITTVISCKRRASTEEVDHYKKDTLTLARWLDVTIVKRKGRAYPADTQLIDISQSVKFPPLKCFLLTGEEVSIPQYYENNEQKKSVKLIAFSFKHYGFTLIRSWLDPFLLRYRIGDKNLTEDKDIMAIEICFVEYSFLSMAKSVFANNIKNQINHSQIDYTVMSFGSIMV